MVFIVCGYHVTCYHGYHVCDMGVDSLNAAFSVRVNLIVFEFISH